MASEERDETEQSDDGGDGLQGVLADSGETEFVTDAPAKNNQTPLMALALVVLLAGGGYWFFMRNGPKPAAAAGAGASTSANQTIHSFLSNGQQNIKMMQLALHNMEKVKEQFLTQKQQVPLSALSSNPFRSTPATSDQPANVDYEALARKREEEKRDAMTAAQALNLQSVLVGGARKTCMIDGKGYAEGQTVGPFVIESIGPDSIVIRSGANRFRKSMSH